jgi:hypothetical protein
VQAGTSSSPPAPPSSAASTSYIQSNSCRKDHHTNDNNISPTISRESSPFAFISFLNFLFPQTLHSLFFFAFFFFRQIFFFFFFNNQEKKEKEKEKESRIGLRQSEHTLLRTVLFISFYFSQLYFVFLGLTTLVHLFMIMFLPH